MKRSGSTTSENLATRILYLALGESLTLEQYPVEQLETHFHNFQILFQVILLQVMLTARGNLADRPALPARRA